MLVASPMIREGYSVPHDLKGGLLEVSLALCGEPLQESEFFPWTDLKHKNRIGCKGAPLRLPLKREEVTWQGVQVCGLQKHTETPAASHQEMRTSVSELLTIEF